MKRAFARLAVLLLIGISPIHFAAAAPPKTKQSAKQPAIVPVTASGLKKEIAARRGRVVLVNFWATWCGPCVEEFPDLVRLQKKYAGKGLSVVFVSADDLDTRQAKVAPFIAKNGLAYASWIIRGNPFDFIPQFDPNIKGAFGLPRTYVYDRRGKLVTVFSDAKSYAEFEKIVKPLL
jgi:thiol-disulfide isomerase/thioredoxin